MSDAPAFFRDVIETVAASLAVLSILFGVVWTIGRRHFDGAVIGALHRERERVRALYAELFEYELAQAAQTHAEAERTREAVERLEREFAEFRRDTLRILNELSDLLRRTREEVAATAASMNSASTRARRRS